ncbi:MAG TPA: SGNH/GDSL hydrolase family protein [Planctomycetes bacterium]|nr:SGNH/GDSL hydrolase family protein [Planctomycetota bacterium]
MKRLSVIILFWVFAYSCPGGEFKKTLDTIELSDGDTFVFCGDSITHQCLYTQYIEDYFYTRYPKRRIHFRNAGIGGDIAGDALVRFENDIAKFKPKYVSVLIGMNDGRYIGFKDEIFNTYKNDMTKLADKIEEIQAAPIFITPTIYDLRVALAGENWIPPEKARNYHYNAVLAFFGAWLRQLADERGAALVDMFEPLNRATRRQRKNNPQFTMLQDAVHPGPDGQLIMALAFLTDLNADPTVSTINIVREKDKWSTKIEKGKLREIKTTDDKISFTFGADSLPWVVPSEAALGYKISDAGRKMSREIVRIVGLEPGSYELKIDDKTVGTYSYEDFAGGIQLQENKMTPQYAQAMKVAMLNKQRNEDVVSPIRDLWLELKTWRNRLAGTHEEDEEMEQLNQEDFDKWYARFKKDNAQLLKKAAQLEDKIYKTNSPDPRKYEIVRLK